jgi:hypothetical protein
MPVNIKLKGPKHDSQNQLRSPMTEGDFIVSIIITLFRIISIINMNISNDPCEYRNIHYWVDGTLGY